MRVAYVCADPGVPVFGRKGASVHVQEVVRALLRRGARVTLFASRTGGEVPAGLEGVEVRRLPRPKSIDGRALPAADRERALQAADAQLPAALAAAGPFDLVYERYALWSTGALRHARATGTPSVLEVNAPLVDEQAEHRELIDAAGALRATQVAFAEADAVVAVSRPVADWARALGPPAARVHVVPNGVDPDRFPPRAAAGRRTTKPDFFTVGFVGTLKPWHGTEVLVDAVARMGPDVRLLLVGDGPERARLLARAAAAGLGDRLVAIGAVDPADVPGHLARMDVAVAPYPPGDSYFSPLKVFEYLAAGVPLVASRVGQVPELLRDGEHAVLVTPGDAGELAAALETLRREPARRDRLGRAGWELVRRDHTWDGVVDRVLALVGLAAPDTAPAPAEVA